jgi:folate-dependent phosphoribosylglycinamide formyltransferase PurN
MTTKPNSLRVAVLSCGDLGDAVAQALSRVPGVGPVALVTAPYVRKRLSLMGKIRHIYHAQGPLGLLGVLVAKVRHTPVPSPEHTAAEVASDVERHHFSDFHDPACLATLRAFAPDLGVVAGTYILKDAVFSIPRLGSINLHSGKAPEYRGAAPAFWELFNGEREVGITVHRVATALDAGDILLQETFPLDPAPADDPLGYLERYRREVLRPNGVRLLAQAVAQIASDSVRERRQDPARAKTYRTPDYRAIRELRRRVEARRLERGTVETRSGLGVTS